MLARPPEPTPEEAAEINGAHDAIQARYGRINWGERPGPLRRRPRPMKAVWLQALDDGVITQEAYDLAKRDSGLFWEMSP
jgi:hypothetical protein